MRMVPAGALGALLGCGGPAAPPRAPAAPLAPPVIQVPAEPRSAPPDRYDCTVEIERHGEQWEAEAKGSSAEAARSVACDAACDQLTQQRGADCRDASRFKLIPWETRANYGASSVAGAFTNRCVVTELQIETRAGSSRESLSGACLKAHRALCPDGTCLGLVRSVGGLAVARLAELVTLGRRHPSSQVAEGGGSTCDLELVFRGPAQEGEASDDVSGAPDMEALAEEARAAACRKLGVEPSRCADSDHLRQISSSRQHRFVSGHASGTVKITLDTERSVEVTGRGADRESACIAAVAEACRDQACVSVSKLFVRHLDGVDLRPPVPKHLPVEGIFGIGR